jgi:hypothetical protein
MKVPVFHHSLFQRFLFPNLYVFRLQATQHGAEQANVDGRSIPVCDNLIRAR